MNLNVTREPRFWGEKVPQEKWNRNLPSIAVPEHMYEALQELAVHADYEFGGKVAPIIREALEEFIERYAGGQKASVYKQMRAFRDAWAEEVVAMEMIENAHIVGAAFRRWLDSNNIEQILNQFDKLLNSLRFMPETWRGFLVDKVRGEDSVGEALKFVYEAGDEGEKMKAEMISDLLYNYG